MLVRPALFWASIEPGAVPGILDAAALGLSPAERSRAERFRDADSRSRFVVGAHLLRHAVEEETGVARDDFVVTRRCPDCGREHGRPVISPARPEGSAAVRDVEVSVSHSGPWVVVALSSGVPVGVDIEVEADGATTGLRSDLVLHPREVERAPVTSDRLLRTWVRKEALLKATGDGLRLPPAGILLGEGRVTVEAWEERPELARRAAIVDLDAPTGVVGAVAVVGADGPVGLEPVSRPAPPWARA